MNISMFDILGPIMIGLPVLIHAGAQRIGKAMYNMIADKELTSVHFMLHGSFHLTLRGHGTDRALVGGVLGMNANDPQIKNSLQIAQERGIEVSFEGADLGDVHPNTVRIIARTSDGQNRFSDGLLDWRSKYRGLWKSTEPLLNSPENIRLL